MNDNSENKIRVLVIGEAGVGKSSVVDLLTRKDGERLEDLDITRKYINSELAPTTYTTDKFIVTDTRSIEPSITTQKRKLGPRKYMEQHKEGFNIVLVVFTASLFHEVDRKTISLYRKFYPELVDIMHIAFTNWENYESSEEYLMDWVGTKDVARLGIPPFDPLMSPEEIEETIQTRMETLQYLENYQRASKKLYKFIPGTSISAPVAERVDSSHSSFLGFKIRPTITCIVALGVFVYVVKRLG